MSKCRIWYCEGWFLDDDALLYDIDMLSDVFGDMIPVLGDEGTCATFNTDCDVELSPMSDIEMLADGNGGDELRVWRYAFEQTASKLRSPVSEPVSRCFASLRLPDPVVNSCMYLLVAGSGGYFFYIICGLRRLDLYDPGWPPVRVAEWMEGRANWVRNVLGE